MVTLLRWRVWRRSIACARPSEVRQVLVSLVQFCHVVATMAQVQATTAELLKEEAIVEMYVISKYGDQDAAKQHAGKRSGWDSDNRSCPCLAFLLAPSASICIWQLCSIGNRLSNASNIKNRLTDLVQAHEHGQGHGLGMYLYVGDLLETKSFGNLHTDSKSSSNAGERLVDFVHAHDRLTVPKVKDRLRVLKTVWILSGGPLPQNWFNQNGTREALLDRLRTGLNRVDTERIKLDRRRWFAGGWLWKNIKKDVMKKFQSSTKIIYWKSEPNSPLLPKHCWHRRPVSFGSSGWRPIQKDGSAFNLFNKLNCLTKHHYHKSINQSIIQQINHASQTTKAVMPYAIEKKKKIYIYRYI